ncbi:hypothetical protein DOTSEDRAFT_49987 [Dothistroma septosporum NZE10]|uniref:Stc1 domain-containing protein n=1 Tax=Dothistroma septosporum (strain NZE10 / CBS 128990) TaxID=675120 RepID=N1Q207_DOTSN|nr:hypothetical protein DOTSEDRAFT_49987 [Dothistroma septosporum NZE10]
MAPAATHSGYNNYNHFPRQNGVAVPSSIKCTRCDIVKSKGAFSNGPQADLVAHMKRIGPGFNAAKTAYIACMACTPKQVVELHCYMCDMDKGLDKFFKTQRRTPDHALCMACQQDKLNYEPGAMSDDDSSGGGTDDSEDSDDDRLSLVDGITSMSVSGAGTMPPARSSTVGGGVSLDGSKAPSSTVTASTTGAPTTASTTDNVTSRAASSRASAAAVAARYGTPSSRTASSVAGTTTSTRPSGSWAKPKTIQRKIQYDDVAQQKREEQMAKGNVNDDEKEYCGAGSDSD